MTFEGRSFRSDKKGTGRQTAGQPSVDQCRLEPEGKVQQSIEVPMLTSDERRLRASKGAKKLRIVGDAHQANESKADECGRKVLVPKRTTADR
jgi:hypothetical protein